MRRSIVVAFNVAFEVSRDDKRTVIITGSTDQTSFDHLNLHLSCRPIPSFSFFPSRRAFTWTIDKKLELFFEFFYILVWFWGKFCVYILVFPKRLVANFGESLFAFAL